MRRFLEKKNEKRKKKKEGVAQDEIPDEGHVSSPHNQERVGKESEKPNVVRSTEKTGPSFKTKLRSRFRDSMNPAAPTRHSEVQAPLSGDMHESHESQPVTKLSEITATSNSVTRMAEVALVAGNSNDSTIKQETEAVAAQQPPQIIPSPLVSPGKETESAMVREVNADLAQQTQKTTLDRLSTLRNEPQLTMAKEVDVKTAQAEQKNVGQAPGPERETLAAKSEDENDGDPQSRQLAKVGEASPVVETPNVTINQEIGNYQVREEQHTQPSPPASFPSSSLSEMLPRAIEMVKLAIEADQAKDFPKALDLYQRSLDLFVVAIKMERNPALKDRIREKTHEYLDRAQKLMTYIEQTDGKKHTRREEPWPGSRDGNLVSVTALQEKPNIRWKDVAGLEDAKMILQELVVFPIKFPQLFVGKRQLVKTILLYGPPGSGKSHLAKAVATESTCAFFSVSISDLASRYIGESARLTRELFATAKDNKPSVIFIDEIDALFDANGEIETETKRRIKGDILSQLDGMGPGVFVLGATSIPWQLDRTIKQCFQQTVYLTLPDSAARTKMFKIAVGNTPCDLEAGDFKMLGEMSEGYSGSDIENVVQDALLQPVRTIHAAEYFKYININDRKIMTPCSPSDQGAIQVAGSQIAPEDLLEPPLQLRDFKKALGRARPSISAEEIKKHEEWKKVESQSAAAKRS